MRSQPFRRKGVDTAKARVSLTPQPNTPMKTTLLTAIFALSPGFAFPAFAQEKKPDGPREEHKEHADRERHEAAEVQARENVERKVKGLRIPDVDI